MRFLNALVRNISTSQLEIRKISNYEIKYNSSDVLQNVFYIMKKMELALILKLFQHMNLKELL